jgi:hypothetical protein
MTEDDATKVVKHLLGKSPDPIFDRVRGEAFKAGIDRARNQPNFKGDISDQLRHVSAAVEKGGAKWLITESSGFIGNRSSVLRHLSTAAQKVLSHLTGRDAAHRFGRHAGGPAGPENLSLFHSGMNRQEQWHRVEKWLQEKLKSGSAVFQVVRDVYRVGSKHIKPANASQYGSSSPICRVYEILEIKANGMIEKGRAIIHGNFGHPPKGAVKSPPKAVDVVDPNKVIAFPKQTTGNVVPMPASNSKPRVVGGKTAPKQQAGNALAQPSNVADLSARRALRVSQYQSQGGSLTPTNATKTIPNASGAKPVSTPQAVGKQIAAAKTPNADLIRNALKAAPLARSLGPGKAFRVPQPSAAGKVASQVVGLLRKLLPIP